jgi:hypothetical protein
MVDEDSAKRCPKCGFDVPFEAFVCPQCGADLRPGRSSVQLWMGAVLILFALPCLMYGGCLLSTGMDAYQIFGGYRERPLNRIAASWPALSIGLVLLVLAAWAIRAARSNR